MTLLLATGAIILWLIIGLIKIRGDRGGWVAMIAHNHPTLGLLLLVVGIVFWPEPLFRLVIFCLILPFIKD